MSRQKSFLYGSECWRMTPTDIQKLEVFQNKCLRQICKIFYPEIISNEDLLQLTNVIEVERNIANRRHRLLGHILRMDNQRVPKVALKWTPANGKRNRGRPKTTWRRTMIKDLEKMGLTLKEAEKVAKDRRRWRGLIGPLAPTAETWDGKVRYHSSIQPISVNFYTKFHIPMFFGKPPSPWAALIIT